jgi:hypothetical protein
MRFEEPRRRFGLSLIRSIETKSDTIRVPRFDRIRRARCSNPCPVLGTANRKPQTAPLYCSSFATKIDAARTAAVSARRM